MPARLLCVVVVLLGAALIVQASGSRPPADPNAAARLVLAREGLALAQQRHDAGAASLDQVLTWSLRIVEASPANGAEAVAAATEHLDRVKMLVQQTREGYEAGKANGLDLVEAKFRQLEAEALLAAAGKD